MMFIQVVCMFWSFTFSHSLQGNSNKMEIRKLKLGVVSTRFHQKVTETRYGNIWLWNRVQKDWRICYATFHDSNLCFIIQTFIFMLSHFIVTPTPKDYDDREKRMNSIFKILKVREWVRDQRQPRDKQHWTRSHNFLCLIL
jgi:hypothetical protein